MKILWDFDGTLIDTYPVYAKTLKRIIAEKMGRRLSEATLLKHLKQSFRHTSSHFNLSEEVISAYDEAELMIPPDFKKPFPGVREVLKKAELNVIMTHKSKQEAIDILTYHGLEGYFTDMIGGDEGYPRKPDPSAYAVLYKRHNLDLVIGDRLLDIDPGRKIGLSTCLFQNREEGADFYIDDYRDPLPFTL